MQIIPVMDLSKGRVVHAIKGERQNYKAITSQICDTASPVDVIDGFLNIYNFKTLYIADLDALEHQGNNTQTVLSICKKYSDITVWLDCGINTLEEALHLQNVANLRLILSSESMQAISEYRDIISNNTIQNFILSLDFRNDELLGANDLLTQQHLWPETIIILNLSNVGSNTGFIYPPCLKNYINTKQYNFFVGGGIRNMVDITNLHKQGTTGVLVSSALHSQAITASDVANFMQSL